MTGMKCILSIKLRRKRLKGHVERMGRGELHAKFWSEYLKGKRPLERFRRKWNNIKRILNNQVMRVA
jgi:hypothetical protein